MGLKTPLVLGSDGIPQQLQSGDTIAVPVTTTNIRAVTNGESSVAVVIGMPVYASAADTVKRAQANAKTTSKVIGLVYDASIAAGSNGSVATDGVVVATTAQWDAVTGGTGGLTFNTVYFLDPSNAGKLTATPPTTVGQCNAIIGVGLSTTELALQIEQPILL